MAPGSCPQGPLLSSHDSREHSSQKPPPTSFWDSKAKEMFQGLSVGLVGSWAPLDRKQNKDTSEVTGPMLWGSPRTCYVPSSQ